MQPIKHVLAKKSKAIWSIGPDEPVLHAIRLMSDKSIGALPVMQDGQLVGILSERDYARKVILMGRSSADTPISQIMTKAVITVTPDDTVHDCMEIMTEKRIRHLPVMDKGKVIGMISIGDLVKAVIEEQLEPMVRVGE
jgi:CBS domain-containing protein